MNVFGCQNGGFLWDFVLDSPGKDCNCQHYFNDHAVRWGINQWFWHNKGFDCNCQRCSWIFTLKQLWIINVMHAIDSFTTILLARIAIVKGVSRVYSWKTISMTTRWVFARLVGVQAFCWNKYMNAGFSTLIWVLDWDPKRIFWLDDSFMFLKTMVLILKSFVTFQPKVPGIWWFVWNRLFMMPQNYDMSKASPFWNG